MEVPSQPVLTRRPEATAGPPAIMCTKPGSRSDSYHGGTWLLPSACVITPVMLYYDLSQKTEKAVNICPSVIKGLLRITYHWTSKIFTTMTS